MPYFGIIMVTQSFPLPGLPFPYQQSEDQRMKSHIRTWQHLVTVPTIGGTHPPVSSSSLNEFPCPDPRCIFATSGPICRIKSLTIRDLIIFTWYLLIGNFKMTPKKELLGGFYTLKTQKRNLLSLWMEE